MTTNAPTSTPTTPTLSHKPRNIILCFDGTQNEFDDTNTNVVKLFSYLKKTDTERQIVYYQTGVGTYVGNASFITRPFAKALDLAVAWHLGAHVKGGYMFLQNHYRPGDRICLFGFSRGAYTARALAGMLSTVGLLPPNMPEQVPFAFNIYKKDTPATRIQSAAYKKAFCREVRIEFMGLWDTVSSVGAILPRVLPFSASNTITKTFRHALALDEHRAKFRSNVWHRSVDPPPQPAGQGENSIGVGLLRTAGKAVNKAVKDATTLRFIRAEELARAEKEEEERERRMWEAIYAGPHGNRADIASIKPTDVKEVWFAGCHCDVGGGNAKDKAPHALANIPLRWMVKEIVEARTGIVFRKSALMSDGIDLDALIEASHAKRHSSGDECTPEEEANALLEAAEHEELGRPSGDSATGLKTDKEKEIPKSADYLDAICPITDELKKSPAWWLLEVLPFIDARQDEDDNWVNRVRINFFRPRSLPKPPRCSGPNANPNSSLIPSENAVSIPPIDAYFHTSVRERMNAPEAMTTSVKSFWRKKEYYRPRAMKPGMKIAYID